MRGRRPRRPSTASRGTGRRRLWGRGRWDGLGRLVPSRLVQVVVGVLLMVLLVLLTVRLAVLLMVLVPLLLMVLVPLLLTLWLVVRLLLTLRLAVLLSGGRMPRLSRDRGLSRCLAGRGGWSRRASGLECSTVLV